ncbi:nuclear transport factor 2 family protein [Plastoroseomonas hellenica]|uniref:nuclear transport factor 2 family protein n=1 Tax=Plastoroseomonas hellenica TaxID=2687306 RepID=UPI001BAB479F|nr:nuclear transport factor 2 family protein [Plastoroseomonas hellenica]MBR0647676.1 nuclear transport factor 2 family protein [Plastoroseomonas hellenica]
MDSADPATLPTVARLTELYDEYARGNRNVLFDALAEDVVWTSNGGRILPWSGRHTGRAGVEAYFRHLDGEVAIIGYAVERVIAQGDWVIVMAKARARFRNGEEWILAKVDLVRMDGDRIAEFQEYYDSAGLEFAMAPTGGVTRLAGAAALPSMVLAAASPTAGDGGGQAIA